MFRNVKRATLIIVFAAGLAANATADTIYVCWDGGGDYPTIQEGIDVASDADGAGLGESVGRTGGVIGLACIMAQAV